MDNRANFMIKELGLAEAEKNAFYDKKIIISYKIRTNLFKN